MRDSAPQPDHGSTLVWSNDDQKNGQKLLEKYNGDANEALKRLFETGGTEYAEARRLSGRFAKIFGVDDLEFMKRYRRWRRGQPLAR